MHGSPLEEAIKNALAKDLESCVVGIVSRRGEIARIVYKPLACYSLYRGSLVDPWGTQIPLHRVHCIACKGLRVGDCKDAKAECQVLKGSWSSVVVCKCGSGYVVRGPRGYDPVYALAGPPFPLIYSGRIVDCVPEGKCEGFLEKRDVWYWYY